MRDTKDQLLHGTQHGDGLVGHVPAPLDEVEPRIIFGNPDLVLAFGARANR